MYIQHFGNMPMIIWELAIQYSCKVVYGRQYDGNEQWERVSMLINGAKKLQLYLWQDILRFIVWEELTHGGNIIHLDVFWLQK